MVLLERESQLGLLRSALSEAEAGRGCIVLVSGEAGIGKTKLVELFVSEQKKNWRILWGSCDALFTPRPLGPFYDVALQMNGDLSALLDSDASRSRIFQACLSEVQAGKTILVIEDVHWADEATLDLIKYIARRIRPSRTLIILTHRDDEVNSHYPLRILLGNLATLDTVHRVPLAALSEKAVHEMSAGKQVDAAELFRLTNGNPFFVTEVLDGGGGIPSTVRDVVLARAAHLSPSGRSALETVAVIGSRAEAWILAQMIPNAASDIDECVSVGMLQSQDKYYAFRHELARQTILEATSPQHKILLHKMALEVFRKSPLTRSDLARLANHAEGAGDASLVLEYAPVAARKAASVDAHHEARAYYALALRYADGLSPVEHADLLENLARESNATDRREEGIRARLAAIEIWRELGNVLKEGENLTLMMVMYFGIGQTAEAEQVTKKAVELLEQIPPTRELARAYRARGALCMFNRDVDEAVAWSQKSIELAEKFDDHETIAACYNAMGSSWIVSDYERGRGALEKSLTIARGKGLRIHIANAFTNLGSAAGEVYHYVDADRYLDEGIAYSIEHDFDVSSHYMLAWKSLAHLFLGRWDEAGKTATLVLKRPGVSAISRIMALIALGRLRARRGDPNVWDALDEALVLAEKTETLQRIAPVRAARAEAAWLNGDYDRCLEEARACYALAKSKKHGWFVGELALWMRRAGDKVTLPSWTAKPFAYQILGKWNKAALAWSELGCPYERASALTEGNRAAQFSALEIFENMGARPALDILRQKMRAEGIRGIPRGPRPATRQHRYGLTNRELEILRLISDGLSNQAIASRLHISLRTVEHHVAAITGKLGVKSRAEAIALALREPGLLTK